MGSSFGFPPARTCGRRPWEDSLPPASFAQPPGLPVPTCRPPVCCRGSCPLSPALRRPTFPWQLRLPATHLPFPGPGPPPGRVATLPLGRPVGLPPSSRAETSRTERQTTQVGRWPCHRQGSASARLGVGATGKRSFLLPPARTLECIEAFAGVGHMHRGPWRGRSPTFLSRGVSLGGFCRGEVSGVHSPSTGQWGASRCPGPLAGQATVTSSW